MNKVYPYDEKNDENVTTIDVYHGMEVCLIEKKSVDWDKVPDWEELEKFAVKLSLDKISADEKILFVSHRWETREDGKCGYKTTLFDRWLDEKTSTKPKQLTNLKRIIGTRKIDKYKYLWIDIYNEFLLPEVKIKLFSRMDLLNINFEMTHFSRAWIFFEFISTRFQRNQIIVCDADGVFSESFQQKVIERLDLIIMIIGIIGEDSTVKEVLNLAADRGSLTSIWNTILSQFKERDNFLKSLRELRTRILNRVKTTNLLLREQNNTDHQDFLLSFMSDLKKLTSDENTEEIHRASYAIAMFKEDIPLKDPEPFTSDESSFQRMISKVAAVGLTEMIGQVDYDSYLKSKLELLEETRRSLQAESTQIDDEIKRNWKSFIGSIIVVIASIIINIVTLNQQEWTITPLINAVTQTAAILTTLFLGFYDLITIRNVRYGWMVKASFFLSQMDQADLLCKTSRRIYFETKV